MKIDDILLGLWPCGPAVICFCKELTFTVDYVITEAFRALSAP